jgi:DNA-binding MarR family transcriptional regulator
MSRMVEALVAAGLVRRAAVAGDRRSVLLRATPAGRRLMLAGRQRRVARLTEFLIELPAKDLRSLSRAADLLTGLIERGVGAGRQ